MSYIPVSLEDARFRKSERFITKAYFLSRVTHLKRNITLGMIYSVFPKGWFRNALSCVIDFENEQPFSTINALPKAFLIPAESCIF